MDEPIDWDDGHDDDQMRHAAPSPSLAAADRLAYSRQPEDGDPFWNVTEAWGPV